MEGVAGTFDFRKGAGLTDTHRQTREHARGVNKGAKNRTEPLRAVYHRV
jgi:hypothetical protein